MGMGRREFRYFMGFLDTQEKWINEMASIPYALLAIAMVLLLIPIALYSRRISMYKRLRMTNE